MEGENIYIMRKIFASTMLLLLFCGMSSADIVYTTTDGKLGLIKISEGLSIDAPAVKYSSSSNNLFVASYEDDGSQRVILTTPTSNMNTSGDTALIFSSSNLSTPLQADRIVLEGVYNSRSAAISMNGRSIFFASYENASISEFSTETMNLVRSYTYSKASSADTYDPKMEKVLTDSNSVYGLLRVSDEEKLFLRFDGQLRDDIEDFGRISTRPGASVMARMNDGNIILGHSSGVDMLYGRETKSLVQVLSTDNAVKALCSDSGRGFYLATQSYSDGIYSNNIYHYEYDNDQISRVLLNETGENCQLLRETNHNLLAILVGEKILLYRISDNVLIAEFNTTALGGMPSNIAMSTVDVEDSSSSSGCNSMNVGMISVIVIFAGMIFRRR